MFIGETIRNWRQRYFYLFEDGSLRGFKQRVDSPFTIEPLNNFTVQGCQIMKTDRPKPYTFIIRGLQFSRVLERTFCTESESDRQDWINSIERVADSINQAGQSAGSLAFIKSASNLASSGTISENNKMITNTPVGSYGSSGSGVSYMDVDLSNKFGVQGISYGGSGKKKVVSFLSLYFYYFIHVIGGHKRK